MAATAQDFRFWVRQSSGPIVELRAIWLQVTRETGPRSRRVLFGQARHWFAKDHCEQLLEFMLARGEFVKYGSTKRATYGPPQNYPRRRRTCNGK